MQNKINQDNILKNCTMKSIHVWANFINKVNEQIKFKLRISDAKLKTPLSEEDKPVSSRNLKIHYFEKKIW